MKRFKLKNEILHHSISTIIVLGLASGNVFADNSIPTEDNSNQSDTDASLEEVTVTGYQAYNQTEIDTKRMADGVMDVVSQDQVGKLPDSDITQAAQRIPGVNALPGFGTTADRSSDEGQALVIRGMSPEYNSVTFDDVPIASADEKSRRFKTNMIPPSVISQIQVLKTVGADKDPHALSGILNLKSASAFDNAGLTGNIRYSGGQNSTSGDVLEDEHNNQKLDMFFSDVFGAAKQFGVVGALSYHQFYSSNYQAKPGAATGSYLFYDGISTTPLDPADWDKSNGFAAASRNQLFAFDNERTRKSALLKFEYEPTDNTYAGLSFLHFNDNDDETRWENLSVNNGGKDIDLSSQTATSGHYNSFVSQYGYVHQPLETTNNTLIANFKHAFDEDQVVHANASYSKAKSRMKREFYKFTNSSINGGFDYDLASGSPNLSYDDRNSVGDLSNYTSDYLRYREHNVDQTLHHIDVDYAFNFDVDDTGLAVKLGLANTKTSQDFDYVDTQDTLLNPDGSRQSIQNYVHGTKLNGFDGVPFYLMNGKKVTSEWQSHGPYEQQDRSDKNIASDYSVEEDVYGAFGTLAYRTERYSIQTGLRYDRADIDVDNYRKNANLPNTGEKSSQYEKASSEGSYSNILPSLIGRYNINENLVLRAAYTNTIGRPDLDDYAKGQTIGDVENGAVGISQGNPDLKPRKSNNFDFSSEYYFDNDRSMISAALFYKDVEDMIYDQVTTINNYNLDSNNQDITATITQPMNASTAKMQGLELSIRKDFDSLLPAPFNGFILNANTTFLNGSQTIEDTKGNSRKTDWQGQPSFLANVGISYEQGPFSTNVSYNYTGEYIAALNASSKYYDVITKSRSQVDLQARYAVTDNAALLFEVQNLTEQDLESVRKLPSGELDAQTTEVGRIIWLGGQYSF